MLIAVDPVCHRSLAVLSVLDRQIIAAHRAGASGITVVHEGDPPRLTRAQELGIEIELVREVPRFRTATLLVAGNLAVQEKDLKQVLVEHGRLQDSGKTPLPCGVAASWSGDLEGSLPDGPRVTARGVARLVKDDLSAVQVEDDLWDTMGLDSDSLMDRNFNRPLGRPLSRLLIHTRISPNVISVMATLIGVVAAWCFSRGTHEWMILGAMVLQISAVADCVDGDLARMMHKESAAGKWLDFGGGQLVHLCLFAGMGAGLYQLNNQTGPAPWLGLAAVVGMLIAFVIVLRAKLNPTRHPRLQSLIQKTAHRDFTLVLLALAIANRVEWFLWAGAIGVNGFCLLALKLQRTGSLPAEEESA